ncbi:MAG TPA: hypothetical protein VFN74_00255 [Chloroflexota bacterium]|nr:hypothetical protein [Chloroflexota bacterium]
MRPVLAVALEQAVEAVLGILEAGVGHGKPGAAQARRALSKARTGRELEQILADFAQRPERYEQFVPLRPSA